MADAFSAELQRDVLQCGAMPPQFHAPDDCTMVSRTVDTLGFIEAPGAFAARSTVLPPRKNRYGGSPS
jgi:hypothetical protein